MKTPLTNSITIFWMLILCLFTSITTLSALPDGEIEAFDDYYSVIEGDSITFNVLENDIGGDLKVISHTSPVVGSLSLGEVEGEFTFYSEGFTSNHVGYFEYEIQDTCGQTEIGVAVIFIESMYLDLIVQTERDCTNAEEKGTYTLNTLMLQGKPPYYYIVGAMRRFYKNLVLLQLKYWRGFPIRS